MYEVSLSCISDGFMVAWRTCTGTTLRIVGDDYNEVYGGIRSTVDIVECSDTTCTECTAYRQHISLNVDCDELLVMSAFIDGGGWHEGI